MVDLKEYDEGASIYLDGLKINRLPLYSWDFYSDFLLGLSGNILDAKKLKEMAISNDWILNLNLQSELDKDTVIVVTDAKLQIVFSSKNIIKMNGYKQEEIIGKSPKMFQGKNTCATTSKEIREAILEQKPFEKWVLNYCKNGKPYNCHIKGYPIFNTKGDLSHFIALEKVA